jgi:hypothetical protein
MKSYLIDEIPKEDMDRAVEHLRNNRKKVLFYPAEAR